MLWLLFFLVLVGAATAQQAPDATARLEGVVLSSTENTPLRKASVVAYPEDGESENAAGRVKNTITNDQGRFALELTPGRYRVTVSRNGYLEQEYGAVHRSRGVPLSLVSDQTLSITVRLVPTAVVHGRVTDEDGEPLTRVVVSVSRYSYMRGRRSLMSIGQQTTNDLGEYRIADLRPGSRYFVSASYFGAAPSETGSRTLAYSTTYYPGVIDPSEATPVSLAPGEDVRIEFQLHPRPAFKISGRIAMEAPSDDKSQITVMLEGSVYSGQRLPALASGGKFEIEGVPSGTHALIAFAIPEDRERMLKGEMRFGSTKVTVADADVTDVVIPLSGGSGAAIHGRVVVNSTSDSKPDFSQLSVNLEPTRDSSDMSFFAMANARVSGMTNIKPDGTFDLENVPPGDYNALIFADSSQWRDFYAASIEFNGRDALTAPMKVTSAGGTLVITAAPDGGVITGTATTADGKPAAGAAIIAVPGERLRHRDDTYLKAVADQNGHFELRGATPGSYRVFAWDSIDAAEAVYDPEFLNRFVGRGRELSVRPAGRYSLELKVIDTGDEFEALPDASGADATGFAIIRQR